jgi:RNA polymerase sigma-70 factor, ECF subfamily
MRSSSDTAGAPAPGARQTQAGTRENGSDRAQDLHLHLHLQRLRRYARRLVREPAEAEDLVQEALERTIAYSRGGGHIRELPAFLFKVLRNLRRDQLVQRRHVVAHVPVDAVEAELSCPPPQEACMECNDLDKALMQLPPEQREVVLLVGLERFTYKAAAEILGVPIGTVMSRLHRARKALRRIMAGAS